VQTHCPETIEKGATHTQDRLELLQIKLPEQTQEPDEVEPDAYNIVRQSRQIELFVEIAYVGSHTQEEPSVEGILKGSWHMQAP
jgi:hypothetical protein